MRYGIGLPKDELGMVAWLCCRDEQPTNYDKQLIVYEDGRAQLIIAENNILEFPKRSYTISHSHWFRFKYPIEPTNTWEVLYHHALLNTQTEKEISRTCPLLE